MDAPKPSVQKEYETFQETARSEAQLKNLLVGRMEPSEEEARELAELERIESLSPAELETEIAMLSAEVGASEKLSQDWHAGAPSWIFEKDR